MRTNASQLRNITLSARAELIDQARKVAAARGLTLNDAFRGWLESFSKRPIQGAPDPYEAFVSGLGDISLDPMPDREERNRRSA